MITIQIQKFNSTNTPQHYTQSYQVPSDLTLLQSLQYIKTIVMLHYLLMLVVEVVFVAFVLCVRMQEKY